MQSWGAELWLRTVPQSSTGHWWWKLNWEEEDWDGGFLSSVWTSGASEAAQQQEMRPSLRQGKAQHQEGRAGAGWLQTHLSCGLQQMPEIGSMFGHIKHQFRITSYWSWCWPKISDFFNVLVVLVCISWTCLIFLSPVLLLSNEAQQSKSNRPLQSC